LGSSATVLRPRAPTPEGRRGRVDQHRQPDRRSERHRSWRIGSSATRSECQVLKRANARQSAQHWDTSSRRAAFRDQIGTESWYGGCARNWRPEGRKRTALRSVSVLDGSASRTGRALGSGVTPSEVIESLRSAGEWRDFHELQRLVSAGFVRRRCVSPERVAGVWTVCRLRGAQSAGKEADGPRGWRPRARLGCEPG
jgi:hypothetical protein